MLLFPHVIIDFSSPDSRLVAIGSAGGEVSILSTDNNTFELHKSCTPHDFAVTGLVFIEKSQEQHVLISTGADKIVMGHNVPIERTSNPFKHHLSRSNHS